MSGGCGWRLPEIPSAFLSDNKNAGGRVAATAQVVAIDEASPKDIWRRAMEIEQQFPNEISFGILQVPQSAVQFCLITWRRCKDHSRCENFGVASAALLRHSSTGDWTPTGLNYRCSIKPRRWQSEEVHCRDLPR
jgi:hypothetical protein